MGKRSDFKPRKMDQYFTIDPKAVDVLIKHQDVVNNLYFIEPCAGKGHLIRQLEKHGRKCFKAFEIDSDLYDPYNTTPIEIGDAFNIQFTTTPIISNPPWSRPILHKMIEHFVTVSPETWLLFDADWMHTKQARPYLEKFCTGVLTVGRLKWIEGSASVGKDNACWYQFIDKQKYELKGTQFYHG